MRLLITIIAVTLGMAAASAQSGLHIAGLFDGKYRDTVNGTETIIDGSALAPYKLDKYISLTVESDSESVATIEPLVRADGRGAIDREVLQKKGVLYYAFYQLKPLGSGTNRYILYVNRKNKIILVYLEGPATPAQVKKILK